MHVEVGPVPSASVLSWVGYASSVLAGPDDAGLAPDAAHRFRSLLEEWRSVAERSPEFSWSTDVAVDVAEYLVHAFYRLAQRLADQAERRRSPAAPAEGDHFYGLLVRSLLDALAEEGGPSGAEFADHLRNFWPGLDRSA